MMAGGEIRRQAFPIAGSGFCVGDANQIKTFAQGEGFDFLFYGRVVAHNFLVLLTLSQQARPPLRGEAFASGALDNHFFISVARPNGKPPAASRLSLFLAGSP
jgi:hypothetical protein